MKVALAWTSVLSPDVFRGGTSPRRPVPGRRSGARVGRSVLYGMAFEGVSEGFGVAFGVVGVEVADREPGFGDGFGDASGEMAPAGESLVQWLKTLLPSGHAGAGGVAVFHEMQGAARLQYPPQLGECPRQIGNRAQRPRREDSVELFGGEVEVFSGQATKLDRYVGSGDAGAARRMQTCDGSMATTLATSAG
jgi:hypothetical protein